MGTVERIGRKASFFWNKKARKLLNTSGFWFSKQLVRMRSATPKNPLKSVDFGGFFVVLGTFFWRVYLCGLLLTHTVTHNRKKHDGGERSG